MQVSRMMINIRGLAVDDPNGTNANQLNFQFSLSEIELEEDSVIFPDGEANRVNDPNII